MIFQLKTCISSRDVFKFETFVHEGWVWSNQNWHFELILIRTVESTKRWDVTNEMQHLLFQQIYNKKYLICTEWKVSVFGNFLVLIFPHLHWMRRVWRWTLKTDPHGLDSTVKLTFHVMHVWIVLLLFLVSKYVIVIYCVVVVFSSFWLRFSAVFCLVFINVFLFLLYFVDVFRFCFEKSDNLMQVPVTNLTECFGVHRLQ